MRFAVSPRKSPLASLLPGSIFLLIASFSPHAAAADPDHQLDLGGFTLTAPAKWVRQKPKSQIVAYEFAAPAAKGDENDGRLTIMAAGGGVKANLERWYGQFTQPDGSSTAKKAKVEEKKVAGQTVHLVDIPGTFLDKPSPFAPGPATERENYRMLGAVIATPGGDIYLKFYGPAATIEAETDAFREMVDGLQSK